LPPLGLHVNYARKRHRLFAVSDIWQGPTKLNQKNCETTSGLGVRTKFFWHLNFN